MLIVLEMFFHVKDKRTNYVLYGDMPEECSRRLICMYILHAILALPFSVIVSTFPEVECHHITGLSYTFSEQGRNFSTN